MISSTLGCFRQLLAKSRHSEKGGLTSANQLHHTLNNKHTLNLKLIFSSALAMVLTVPTASYSQMAQRTMTDAQLRALAPAALSVADVPVPDDAAYIRNRNWAIVLGKALFWDMQAGGDGVTACASCHFHAGADNRSVNQINPGLTDQTPGVDATVFSSNFTNGGGVNTQLSILDFPIPKEVNDVISSQGVFLRNFNGFQTGAADDCSSQTDTTFNKDGLNTRRVEPRNTPTVINAVFNHRNFWDGRANHMFNGVDPLGPRTFVMPGGDSKGVWKEEVRRGPLVLEQPLMANSSLASQATGPTGSAFEMSCGDNRTMPDLGRKMLRLRALANQEIAADDSVLGTGNVALGSQIHSSGFGLVQTYSSLIRRAFDRKYWGSRNKVNINGVNYSQMEANFALFWGLAIQAYESTLVSDMSPYDDWARGNDNALTEQQKLGLEVFLTKGNCIACHAGPEFTGASVRLRGGANGLAVERMIMGNGGAALYDGGFYNIGVSATLEDIGLGANLGTLPDGTPIPLSFSRQLSIGPLVDVFNEMPFVEEPGVPVGPAVPGERVAVDGAFKTPTIRNVELTAPFFHDGGHFSLLQVVEFYRDQGRNFFAEDNIDNLDADMLGIEIDGFVPGTNERIVGESEALVEFMKALTDERVRFKMAPFDHPALLIPNGHVEPVVADTEFPAEAKTEWAVVPAVGAGGLAVPQANFLE